LSARKAANQDSYLWDFLVDHQAQMTERQSFDSRPSMELLRLSASCAN
jgi:hypothetical protein